MGNISRRKFVQYSSGLLTFAAADFEFFGKKKEAQLSFSTLGCPDWSLPQILDFAVKNGFKGIEIRGIQRQLDLSKSPHFNSLSALTETSIRFAEKKLHIVGLGSSAAMHHAAGADRDKAFDEAKTFIEIASKVQCPYVRVFPDKLPTERDRAEVLDTIATNLRSLGDFAKGSGVSVLMETHGELVHVDDLETVMNKVGDHPNAGLVWDISNMWSVTGESPAEVYSRLKKWIRHSHLKDLKKVDGKDQYTLMGEGEVPIAEAMLLLRKGGYKGYYSFEWEKMWHPEIAEPEVAIAQFAQWAISAEGSGQKADK